MKLIKEIKKIKALVLLSGGLDSILAVKLLNKQGIKVTGVTFKSYFFDNSQAIAAAKNLKIPLKIVDISREHLKIVKNPKYGYGKTINPCIDCHILMLKRAKKIMKKGNFDFVATGEVLGERPMSQNKNALKIIEKESSSSGFLLRPLSAKLLPETIPEKNGQVQRKNLLSLSGRSRKKQLLLAKIWKIKKYPTPAGGCLLTDLEFSKKLKELFKIYPQCRGNDVELLKLGRHFCRPFFGPRSEKTNWLKIIVGRNEKENQKIRKLAKRGNVLIEMKNYPGPSTLIRKYGRTKIPSSIIAEAKKITKEYSSKARNKDDVKYLIKKV